MSVIALAFVGPTSLVAAGLVAGGAFGAALRRRPQIASDTRLRTGRLPLPERLLAIRQIEDPDLGRVNAFVDRLSELPRETWVAVGRRLAENVELQGRRATARLLLDAAIADRGLSLAAWYVKDAVETSAFLAARTAVGMTRSERRAFACAHGAAEVCALALLTERSLPVSDFETLYRPFADEVPATGASI